MGYIEKFKRYGLNFCDFSTMISNVDDLLRVLAVNIDPRRKEPVSIFWYISTIFCFGCYVYVYWVSMAWFVFWRCRETGDLISGIIVFSLGATSSISIDKFVGVFINRSSIRKLVLEYLRCDGEVVPGSRFSDTMKPTLRATKKRALIVWNVLIWNGIIYVVMPLVLPGPRMPEDNFEFFGVENMREYPIYETLFFINSVAVYVTVYPAACVMALFIVLNGYTEAQMLALSEEIKHIWDDALRQYHNSQETFDIEIGARNKNTINDFVEIDLIKILKIHVSTIHIRLWVEKVFKGAVAVEFLLLLVGLIAELSGGLEKTYIELPFAMMFVCNDCITGQKLIDASIIFEQAVYNSRWENFNVNNRKIILLMLQSSQKTMKLSAGGVATLSLECLMGVLRMTYSAYTTLRSTVK